MKATGAKKSATSKESKSSSKGETDVIRLSSAPPWKAPKNLRRYTDECSWAEKYVRQFFPSSVLRSLLSHSLQTKSGLNEKAAHAAADKLIRSVRKYLGEKDEAWKTYFELIFEKRYPARAREVYHQGAFARIPYAGRGAAATTTLATFKSDTFVSFGRPGPGVTARIAPTLFKIVKTKKGVALVNGAEVERFHGRDHNAVLKSALFEIIHYNRPSYRVRGGWEVQVNHLPVQVTAALPILSSPNAELLKSFLADLKATFAWRDDEAFARYCGYLLQPIIAHLYPGMMPGYYFGGPTKAGKGYLSGHLVSVIYHRSGSSTVMVNPLPASAYEFQKFMAGAKDAIFVVFDEVAHMDHAQARPVDSLLTSATIQVRLFQHGYVSIPNYFTVSMTAVTATLSDETDGRLAAIELVQSRPEQIEQFERRWRTRGPELMGALFEAVNAVEVDMNTLPSIPNRRPGFGLVAHFVDKVCGVQPKYGLEARPNPILDSVCDMFRDDRKSNNKKGSWKRYSFANLHDYMVKKDPAHTPAKAKVEERVMQALAYGSTEANPAYCDHGYPSDHGKYHIKAKVEGKDARRHLYVCRAGDLKKSKK